MNDTELLDFITKHSAWVSYAQAQANAGNPKPWRAQTFHSLTSMVKDHCDGATPREAIEGLCREMKYVERFNAGCSPSP